MSPAIRDYVLVIRLCLGDIEDGKSPDDATRKIMELTEEFRKDVNCIQKYT